MYCWVTWRLTLSKYELNSINYWVFDATFSAYESPADLIEQAACSHFNDRMYRLDPDVSTGFYGLHHVRPLKEHIYGNEGFYLLERSSEPEARGSSAQLASIRTSIREAVLLTVRH